MTFIVTRLSDVGTGEARIQMIASTGDKTVTLLMDRATLTALGTVKSVTRW